MSKGSKIRLANFMDSSLNALKEKGNLEEAPSLYNPDKVCEKVVHFTLYEEDLLFSPFFEKWNIEIFCYGRLRGLKKTSLLFAPVLLWTVYRKMKKEKINLVRGRLPYHGSLFGCLSAKFLGIPSVVSLGGNNRISQELNKKYYYGSRFISYNMEKCVLLLADRIICPNKYTTQYVSTIIGRDKAAEKTVVIPWAVKMPSASNINNIEEVYSRFKLNKDRKIILIVGFINRYKFSDVLYEAIEGLEEKIKDRVVFVFCGDGPLKSEGLKRFSGKDYVRFIGWQPKATVRSLMNLATAVLVPMSGFVLLEAASMGKTVITSNLEWHSELVKHNESGLLVEPSSPDEWIKSIRYVFFNEEKTKIFGEKLKERFNQDYHPDKARKEEVDLLISLVTGQSK